MGSFGLLEEKTRLCKRETSLGNINMHKRLDCKALLHYKTPKAFIHFCEQRVLYGAKPSFSYQVRGNMTFNTQGRGFIGHQASFLKTSDNTETTEKEGWALKIDK